MQICYGNHFIEVPKLVYPFKLEHSAILSTFIKLPFVIKIFVLSICELPFYTGFTVCVHSVYYNYMLSEKIDIPLS